MTRYMVDTDVLVWVLRGKVHAVAWLEAAASDGQLLCSALTVSELFRMVRQDELRRTEALIAGLHVVPVPHQDARRAADLMWDRGPGFVDCHIAAAALRMEATVMTYNQGDFTRTGVAMVAPGTLENC